MIVSTRIQLNLEIKSQMVLHVVKSYAQAVSSYYNSRAGPKMFTFYVI